MKFIPILFAAVILSACGTQKDQAEAIVVEVEETVEETTEQVEDVMEDESTVVHEMHAKGEVIVNDSSCPVMIVCVNDKGEKLKLYPINLEQQFRINGTELEFDYRFSRAPQPSGCSVDMVVTVHNISQEQ